MCQALGSGRDAQLQGVWFFNGVEVARIDVGGVLGLKEGYNERASQGQLQVSKLSPKAFSLKIFAAGPEDEGAYRCSVAEMTRAQTGSWQLLRSKQSPDSHVHLRKPAGTWRRTTHGRAALDPLLRSYRLPQRRREDLLKSQVSIRSFWGEGKESTKTS